VLNEKSGPDKLVAEAFRENSILVVFVIILAL
jgi:hypothetical protein